jgi:hypothetical protein
VSRDTLFQAKSKFSQIQPIETKPSKENQRKTFGFPWISLSESSPSNGLRRPPGHFFFFAARRPSKAVAATDNLQAERGGRHGQARIVD